jgi:hypothetical protein
MTEETTNEELNEEVEAEEILEDQEVIEEDPTEEEEEAAFNDAFSDDLDEYEIVDEVVETEEEPAEEEAEETQVQMPEPTEVNSALEAANAHIAALEQRLRKSEGKFGELNSKINEITKARENATPPGHPSREQVAEAIKGGVEAIDTLKEKFPIWAEAVDEKEALRQATLGISEYASKDDLANVVRAENLQGYVSKEDFNDIIQAEREKIILEVKFPNYRQIVRDAVFQEWLPKQDATAQAQYQSGTSADAIKLLEKYEQHLEKMAERQEKTERLERATPATTGRRGSRKPTRSTDEQDFLEGFGQR